jgi:hypothetical protein
MWPLLDDTDVFREILKLALVNDIISICGNIGCLDKKLNLKSGGTVVAWVAPTEKKKMAWWL